MLDFWEDQTGWHSYRGWCWGYAQLPTWRQECLHHCWSPISNPLCQASWLLSGLTLTMHLRLDESYLRQWQISASLKTRGMTRRSIEPVFRMICGQRSVFYYARKKCNHHLLPNIRVPIVYCTDGGRVLGYSWTKRQTVYLLTYVGCDQTPGSALHETVNSGAADDVLPALISRSRRKLRPPRRLGYD